MKSHSLKFNMGRFFFEVKRRISLRLANIFLKSFLRSKTSGDCIVVNLRGLVDYSLKKQEFIFIEENVECAISKFVKFEMNVCIWTNKFICETFFSIA